MVRRFEELVTNLKESLEREMHLGFDEVGSRFDAQSARLERHAGLWQTGARWSRRMDEWADKVDASMEKRTEEIIELRRRVTDLEKRGSNGKA